MAEGNIDLGSNISFEVHVHPLALIQIVDLYYRKYGASKQDNSIVVAGSLLGTVFTNRVHITNCFAVSVDYDEESYALDMIEQKELYDSYLLANPNEILLGAFVTTKDLSLDIGVAYLTTEYSKKENGFIASAVLGQPIILKVDPTLQGKSFDMKAFKLNQSLKHYAAVAAFNTLPIIVSFQDESAQQVQPYLGTNIAQKDFKIVNQATTQASLQQYVKNIDKILNYIEGVIAGQEKGNQDLGRKLLSALNSIDQLKFDQPILLNQIEEAQLYQYLCNFTSGQVIINEELSQI